MYLKIGDVVEFKNYEDMFENETACIDEKYFPKYGKVTEIKSDTIFSIEDSGYLFNPKSVARVIESAEVDEVDDCFIVKEGRYDLYIGGSGDLVSDKDRAKIYSSRDEANEEAADMQLNAWDVIPYDD